MRRIKFLVALVVAAAVSVINTPSVKAFTLDPTSGVYENSSTIKINLHANPSSDKTVSLRLRLSIENGEVINFEPTTDSSYISVLKDCSGDSYFTSNSVCASYAKTKSITPGEDLGVITIKLKDNSLVTITKLSENGYSDGVTFVPDSGEAASFTTGLPVGTSPVLTVSYPQQSTTVQDNTLTIVLIIAGILIILIVLGLILKKTGVLLKIGKLDKKIKVLVFVLISLALLFLGYLVLQTQAIRNTAAGGGGGTLCSSEGERGCYDGFQWYVCNKNKVTQDLEAIIIRCPGSNQCNSATGECFTSSVCSGVTCKEGGLITTPGANQCKCLCGNGNIISPTVSCTQTVSCGTTTCKEGGLITTPGTNQCNCLCSNGKVISPSGTCGGTSLCQGITCKEGGLITTPGATQCKCLCGNGKVISPSGSCSGSGTNPNPQPNPTPGGGVTSCSWCVGQTGTDANNCGLIGGSVQKAASGVCSTGYCCLTTSGGGSGGGGGGGSSTPTVCNSDPNTTDSECFNQPIGNKCEWTGSGAGCRVKKSVCGGSCSKDSDCKVSQFGFQPVCNAGKCVSPLCPTDYVADAQCACKTPVGKCGEKCGIWSDGFHPLCGAGSTCSWINGPTCGGDNKTYCMPITPQAGYTAKLCTSDLANSGYKYLIDPNGNPITTQAQIQAACAETVNAVKPAPEPLPPVVEPTIDTDNGNASGVACGAIDIDRDGKLTITDFAHFGPLYGQTCSDELQTNTTCGNSDTNGDGKVDIIDFGSFATRYLKPSCQI